MKRKPTIYFAHPYNKQETSTQKEIIKLLESCGLEVKNPFEGELDILHKYGITKYYDKPSKALSREIYNRDYELVHSCDFLFAWFPTDTFSIGTPIEFAWAHNLSMFTIVLCPLDHPFPMNMADFHYHNMEEMRMKIKGDVEFIIKEWE